MDAPISPPVSRFFTEAGRVGSGRQRRAVRRQDGRRRASPHGRPALVDSGAFPHKAPQKISTLSTTS